MPQEEDTHVQLEIPLLQQQFLQRHNVLYEKCHHPVTNPVSDGFKKDFSPPISDGYDEDYLDVMPKKIAVDFVSLGHVNEENSIAIQGQKDENREDSEYAKGYSLPLCYVAFELLGYIRKISKQAQKLEDMAFLEIDNEKGKQQCHQSQPMEETTVFHKGLNHK